MNETATIDCLRTCLGRRLVSGKLQFYELEGVPIAELDLAEIIFCFDAPDTILYFSWQQINGDLGLSARNESHFLNKTRPEILAKDNAILSKLLGKRLTIFELFADEFGMEVAALLRFENVSCVIAVVQETWDEETQTAEFRSFSGYELYLWTEEEFINALQKHKLEIVARKEIKTFV